MNDAQIKKAINLLNRNKLRKLKLASNAEKRQYIIDEYNAKLHNLELALYHKPVSEMTLNIIKKIVKLFNLEEGIISETVNKGTDAQYDMIKQSYKQFTADDLEKFTKKEKLFMKHIGCKTLQELSIEKISDKEILKTLTIEDLTLYIIFTKFKNGFSFGQLCTETTLKFKEMKGEVPENAEEKISSMLALYTHKNVKLLLKDNDQYKINYNCII